MEQCAILQLKPLSYGSKSLVIRLLHEMAQSICHQDLTPLHYFRGYVKSLVYADKPRTIEALKHNIELVIHEIPSDLCEKVIQNWIDRIHCTARSRDGHLNDVIFHT